MSGTRFKRPSKAIAIAYSVAITVLLGLGVWQVERLGWKRDLLATISSHMAAPAESLPAQIPDTEQWDYRHVMVMGQFRHTGEIHLHSIGPHGQAVTRIVTPLVRDAGDAVLVDRGWVPASVIEENEGAAISRPPGTVNISGIARRVAGRGAFVPANRPDENSWFYVDLFAAARYTGLDNLAPLLVVEEADATNHVLPRPSGVAVDIPNNHLGYALTWFSLAVVLTIIFLLYHRQRAADVSPPI